MKVSICVTPVSTKHQNPTSTLGMLEAPTHLALFDVLFPPEQQARAELKVHLVGCERKLWTVDKRIPRT